MKVLTEKVENNQATLQVEIEPSELEAYMEKAYRRIVPRVSVAGFRKGKAPRVLLEQQVGREALLQEALEELVPATLEDTLKARSLVAVASPDVKILQMSPITIEAVIPLQPTVRCGDYKRIRLETETTEVTESDVNLAISQIQDQQAVLNPVGRPAQYGDIVNMNIDGISEGKSILKRKGTLYEVVKDSPVPMPGFAENVVGIEAGVEKEFSLSFPEDHLTKELAGKQFSFKVSVLGVKEKRVPELDDVFSKSLGHDTVDLLRAYVNEQLVVRSKALNRRTYERKVLDAVVKVCEVSYPPILIERELDRLVGEEAESFKDNIKGLEAYLHSQSKTFEQHREELRLGAVQRLVEGLVVDKVAEEEKIQVTSEEIDREIGRLTSNSGERAKEMERILTSPQGRHSVEHTLLDQKTVDKLVEIAEGKVVDLSIGGRG